jgi:hypothetical protein
MKACDPPKWLERANEHLRYQKVGLTLSIVTLSIVIGKLLTTHAGGVKCIEQFFSMLRAHPDPTNTVSLDKLFIYFTKFCRRCHSHDLYDNAILS